MKTNTFIMLMIIIPSMKTVCSENESFKSAFRSRIVGGKPANISDVPYQVQLIVFGTLLCGGSIVSSEHVVSAGHCLYQLIMDDKYKSHLMIRAGSSRFGLGDSYGVENITIHPKYDPKEFHYDVAVIKIIGAFNSSRNQIPIPLSKQLNIEPLVGLEGLVSGFGAASMNGQLSHELIALNVPIVSNTICESVYKPSPSKMCAGFMEGKKDACVGDSGGPLALDGTLVGIVSYGFGCAVPGEPGVYTNVAVVHEWIEKIVGKHNMTKVK